MAQTIRKSKKVKVYEFFYLILYFAFSYMYLLNASLIPLGKMYRYTGILCIGSMVLLLLMRLRKRITAKALGGVIILGIVLFTGAIIADTSYVFVATCFVICSDFAPFKKIVKTSILASGIGLLTVLPLGKMGIIYDYVYHGHHSYGFGYYTIIAYLLFFMWIEYLYLRKKIVSYIELVVWIFVHIYIYHWIGVRLTFYLSLYVEILYIILLKIRVINLQTRLLKSFSIIGFPICGIGSVLVSYVFDSNIPVWEVLDSILSTRLSLGSNAISRYSIKLFGQHIEMKGNSYHSLGAADYFYIDNGYLYTILCYGILFFILVIGIYSYLKYYASEMGYSMLWIWISTIMLFNFVNNTWLNISYNPVFLLIVPIMKNHLSNNYRKKYLSTSS